MFNKIGLLMIFVGVGLFACKSGKDVSGDPQRRLSEYISRTFSIKGGKDKQELMGYLTGDAKTRLAAWSEEQFKEAFVDSKRQFLKLAFKEMKPVSESHVSITYEITYIDQGKGHDAKITNKKLCEMVLEQGQWMISDVRSLKELVEYRNEMSLP